MLSSNYSTRKVCHLCEAVKYGAGPPFDDFGAGACHRNTSRDHNSYMLGFATPPPLSLIPGFQLCMLVCDPMHCLHLGVLQWAVGNALVLLSGEGRWGFLRGSGNTSWISPCALRIANSNHGADAVLSVLLSLCSLRIQ